MNSAETAGDEGREKDSGLGATPEPLCPVRTLVSSGGLAAGSSAARSLSLLSSPLVLLVFYLFLNGFEDLSMEIQPNVCLLESAGIIIWD